MPRKRTNNFPEKWAWPSVTFKRDASLANVVFVVYTSADQRTLGDKWRLTGAIMCVITKSAIFNFSTIYYFATLFVYGPKSNHRVAMS